MLCKFDIHPGQVMHQLGVTTQLTIYLMIFTRPEWTKLVFVKHLWKCIETKWKVLDVRWYDDTNWYEAITNFDHCWQSGGATAERGAATRCQGDVLHPHSHLISNVSGDFCCEFYHKGTIATILIQIDKNIFDDQIILLFTWRWSALPEMPLI